MRRKTEHTIGAALDMLEMHNPRMARVVKLRYGFVDGRRHTYSEIGRDPAVKLSCERVSQICHEGMERMKGILHGTGLLAHLR